MKRKLIYLGFLTFIITTILIFQNCSRVRLNHIADNLVLDEVTSPGNNTPPTVSCPNTITAPDTQTPSQTSERILKKINTILGYGTVFPSILSPYPRNNVDFSEYTNVWGYAQTKIPLPEALPWPGLRGTSFPVFKMPRNAYFGAHFKTPKRPEDFMGGAAAGMYLTNNYGGNAIMTVSISKQCGDFSKLPGFEGGVRVPGGDPCYTRNRPNDDSALINWIMEYPGMPEVTRQYQCVLEYDTDYFLNVTMASIENTNPIDTRCTSPSVTGECVVSIGSR